MGTLASPLRGVGTRGLFAKQKTECLHRDGLLPHLPQCASKQFYGHRVDPECGHRVVFDTDGQHDQYPSGNGVDLDGQQHHGVDADGLDDICFDAEWIDDKCLDDDGLDDSDGGVHD